MADKKISQLPAATTPLAGTEVLPIVQSSTTEQVSVANLTAGRAISAASLTLTTSPLAIASGGTNQTSYTSPVSSIAGLVWFDGTSFQNDTTTSHVGYNPSTNVFYANTPTFAGNTTVSTGNLVIGTSGKGIDFSANSSAAGMTSELLNWYETGTWTPTLTCTDGAFTSVTYDPLRGGSYTRIGNVVHIQVYMRTDAVDNTVGRTGDVLIAGLPYAAVSGTGGTLSGHCAFAVGIVSGWTTSAPSGAFVSGGDTNIQLVFRTTANGSTSNITAANIGTAANNNIVLVSGSYVCA